MQADRKKLGIFIIVLGLVIIFLIVYFVFIKKNTSNNPAVTIPTSETITQLPVESGAGTTTPSDAPINHQTYNISTDTDRVTTGDDLGKISMSFAERFGSFSNQSNYGNFTDLKILMSDSMKTWADKYVIDLKKQPQNQNTYYGVTTKALTYKVVSFNDKTGNADIIVQTQRRESTDKINGGEAYNQDLEIILIKINGSWLFDSAVWGK